VTISSTACWPSEKCDDCCAGIKRWIVTGHDGVHVYEHLDATGVKRLCADQTYERVPWGARPKRPEKK
jgi:hypothetical protein